MFRGKTQETLREALHKASTEGGELFVITHSIMNAERLATRFFNMAVKRHFFPERLREFCVKVGDSTVFFRHSSYRADISLAGMRPDAVFFDCWDDHMMDALQYATGGMAGFTDAMQRLRQTFADSVRLDTRAFRRGYIDNTEDA
jgi:hypothetical protein